VRASISRGSPIRAQTRLWDAEFQPTCRHETSIPRRWLPGNASRLGAALARRLSVKCRGPDGQPCRSRQGLDNESGPLNPGAIPAAVHRSCRGQERQLCWAAHRRSRPSPCPGGGQSGSIRSHKIIEARHSRCDVTTRSTSVEAGTFWPRSHDEHRHRTFYRGCNPALMSKGASLAGRKECTSSVRKFGSLRLAS